METTLDNLIETTPVHDMRHMLNTAHARAESSWRSNCERLSAAQYALANYKRVNRLDWRHTISTDELRTLDNLQLEVNRFASDVAYWEGKRAALAEMLDAIRTL